MAGLSDAAHFAKADPVRCPHCGRRFRIFNLLAEIFKAIVYLAEDGERVRILNFGTFYLKRIKPRGKVSPLSKTPVQESAVLRFKMADAVRSRLNHNRPARVKRSSNGRRD